MRYDFTGGVEGSFVMLLANSFGECGGVGGGVGSAVGRGMREGVVGFGREATSAHNIGFCDVVGRQVGEVAGGVAGREAGA